MARAEATHVLGGLLVRIVSTRLARGKSCACKNSDVFTSIDIGRKRFESASRTLAELIETLRSVLAARDGASATQQRLWSDS
jgi:hypothetical protein